MVISISADVKGDAHDSMYKIDNRRENDVCLRAQALKLRKTE